MAANYHMTAQKQSFIFFLCNPIILDYINIWALVKMKKENFKVV